MSITKMSRNGITKNRNTYVLQNNCRMKALSHQTSIFPANFNDWWLRYLFFLPEDRNNNMPKKNFSDILLNSST